MRDNVPSLLAKSLFRGFALRLMLVLRQNNHVLFMVRLNSVVKVVRGLATKRYEFSKYLISKQNKHVCIEELFFLSF